MSTDRELLELAAKAAGMDVRLRYCEAWNGMALYTPQDGYFGPTWNPIADDGDRYRLARDCKLELDFDGSVVKAWIYANDGWHVRKFPFAEGNKTEEAYAVLQAAAEIGKSK